MARRLGKEAAVFVPSGTMGNLACVAAQTRPGDEVIADAQAHLVVYEVGGTAIVAGIQLRVLESVDGIPDAESITAAVREPDVHQPVSTPPLHREHAQPPRWRRHRRDTGSHRRARGARAGAPRALRRGPAVQCRRGVGRRAGASWWPSATPSRSASARASVHRWGRWSPATHHDRVGPAVAQAARRRHASGGRHRGRGSVRARAQRRAARGGPCQCEGHRRRGRRMLRRRPCGDRLWPPTSSCSTRSRPPRSSQLGYARRTCWSSAMGPHTLRCVTHLNVDAAGAQRAAGVVARVLSS